MLWSGGVCELDVSELELAMYGIVARCLPSSLKIYHFISLMASICRLVSSG